MKKSTGGTRPDPGPSWPTRPSGEPPRAPCPTTSGTSRDHRQPPHGQRAGRLAVPGPALLFVEGANRARLLKAVPKALGSDSQLYDPVGMSAAWTPGTVSPKLGAISPRGSIYTTIMELGPQNHNGYGLLGPNSIIVVYMDPLGFKALIKPGLQAPVWYALRRCRSPYSSNIGSLIIKPLDCD